MHPLPKRTKQTHHKKRQIPHHQPPTLPMHALQNLLYGNQRHTPIRKHLTEQQITNICKHLVEKNGIRSIERLTGHHRDTIGNLLEDMAEHATKVNDYLMKNVGLSQFECDELWTFIKKKKKHLSEAAKLSLKAVTATSTPP